MSLAATREGLHRVAEHVLAAAQYAETGHIGLRVVDGGFETMHVLHGSRQLRVEAARLVVIDAHGSRATRLTTVGAVAGFAGITPGMPATVYPPATPCIPDEPLHIHEEDARALAEWYRLADTALRQFSTEAMTPREPILWPEHFDVGITVSAVNFGGSPGDGHIWQPYLYVGPHGGPPSQDAFWNAPFGAARTIAEITSVDAAVAFFHAGAAQAALARP